jgi:tetratricopeptide (TPR) repeat protein
MHKWVAKGPDHMANYIMSMSDLASIQIEMGNAECIQTLMEAIEKSKMNSLEEIEAKLSMELGNAYMDLAGIRNLDQAEYWLKHSLELLGEFDEQREGRILVSLGKAAILRFEEAHKAGRLETERLVEAVEYFQQALNIISPNSPEEMAMVHSAMGSAYAHANMFNEALRHCQEAISYVDAIGDNDRGAQLRFNAAIILEGAGQLSDALKYARSALEKFETLGPMRAKKVQEVQYKIIELDAALESEQN